MIKDTKYIIKRILIGVGIILVLSFIRGNKVKAFESTKSIRDYNYYMNNTDYKYLTTNTYLFSNSSRTNYYFYDNNNNLVVALDTGSITDIYDDRLSQNKNFVIVKNMQDEYNNGLIFFNEPNKLYFQNNTLKYQASSGNYYFNGLKVFGSTPTIIYPSVWKSSAGTYVKNYVFNNNYTNEDIVFSTFDIFDNDGNLIHSSDLISSSIIESLQPTKITNNNVITGYIFRPKFTNFNTDNFVYQYKVGKDSSRWLSLTENEQQIKINNNIELYVRIKDKNSNDVVDSQTFTITDIGTFATQQDYDISFSGEYRTMNYLNNTICVSSSNKSVIKEYQIYIDYLPKASILKYQYQYVKDGDSLDNNNWQNVSSLDNGSITYVSSQNGTLYARILDSTDNVLYTGTFTINSIGKLAIDSKDNCVKNFFTKLSNKIGYGGPISNLFRIPIDILNKIYSYSSYSCSPYKISTLLGTDFVLPCYNFRKTFGDTYYTIFDSLLCFVLSLCLFKFVRNIYDKFINMEDISS